MRQLITILVLILVAVLIDMPRELTLGPRTFYRPTIDLTASGIPFRRDLDFHLGLDLQGGTHLVYQADFSQVSSADKDSAIKATRENIERRVNFLGVSESLVQTSQVGSDYRLIVELPGIKDVGQAVSTIGQTAFLEFRESP